MAKKKKAQPRGPARQQGDKPQEKNNPFEQLHSKRRFDVLGRRGKNGAQQPQKVTKARSAAVEKRKSTLLIEYKALRKANAFIDRRFGEADGA